VVYAGDNDGSNVPPGWNAWLKGTIDELPDKALPERRKFHQPPEKNLTGTMAAFRPDGALGSGKIRPASTGDYRPWTPD
jgi:NADH:ubiquinone oxidoreductase subunit